MNLMTINHFGNKPYFTNKHSKAETDIMLNENGKLILKNQGNLEYF